ncbi:hypothetical protein B0H16DRAFT_1888960 [Mycena metata]|uniref:BRCT domain-containing protein n=1 Tax=Mycena metata TaxID=1033252 RepID=A0AAD7IQY8_9AGAR|nr:hypothetical protein B0H16DRAFT_1888960 [Mycena metata]
MVFRGVKYHIPATFPEPKRAELVRLLKEHHAKSADTVFDATHIITNSEDFKGCEQVNAGKVSVVTGLWVERSIAAKKMQSETYYSASPSKLFSGVIACSADLSPGDEEVFAVTIAALGGQWRVNCNATVTHLFAASRSSKRYEKAMQNRSKTHIKVLLPDWFNDTLRLGTRDLDTTGYEWETPAMEARGAELQSFSLKPIGYSSNVWAGRRILLSSSLDLTPSKRCMVEDGIRKCQGVLVELTSNDGAGTFWEELELVDKKRCEVLITRHRAGNAFLLAWEEGITVGTLRWLLEMQASGIVSGPRDRILHFPHPPVKVIGIKNTSICLSHYKDESAEYLKKLIKFMGGGFTTKLEVDNAVLVVASHPHCKVIADAKERRIPVVNHTWVEDCFIQWKHLDPTLPKYTLKLSDADDDFAAEVGYRGVGSEIEEIVAAEQTRRWHLGR